MPSSASPTLIPLARATRATLGAVRTVLTDIDDTLTTDGHLPARAYDALERLTTAGFAVVPVTGRPAGWCDLIARLWPVAGVVGENGALAYRYARGTRRMVRLYAKDEAARAADRVRLDALATEILAAVPGAALAADQAFRIADLAIDYREDVAPLPASDVGRIVQLFARAGASAKVSSIHVNGWFGSYDKLTMAARLLWDCLGIDLTTDGARVVYVGDSPNDAPFFAALPLTVGVANVLEFTDTMSALPHYVTDARGGEGFVEVADALIAARA